MYRAQSGRKERAPREEERSCRARTRERAGESELERTTPGREEISSEQRHLNSLFRSRLNTSLLGVGPPAVCRSFSLPFLLYLPSPPPSPHPLVRPLEFLSRSRTSELFSARLARSPSSEETLGAARLRRRLMSHSRGKWRTRGIGGWGGGRGNSRGQQDEWCIAGLRGRKRRMRTERIE